MATSETERRSAVFESQRNRLFGIAYRMLGSAAEAEDVVQDAWLRYSASTSPEHDEALLTTVRDFTV